MMKPLSRVLLGFLVTCAAAQEAPGPASSNPTPTVPASANPTPTALTGADATAWLDGYLPFALHSSDIAGAVVVIVKDGQVLVEKGYGLSDVATRAAVDPKTTLFRPGSVSKLFTWTAVMQQVEQGKLDLDTDINKYLDFKVSGRDGKPITLRNLMQHTAGFEEQAKGIISSDSHAPGYEALLKQWVPERVFDPGTTPAYSNYGASLAGYMVQRVSGESFDNYIEKHIFEPLDMKHSTFRQPLPAALEPLMSKGYKVASSDPEPFEIVGPAPAGALSSPGDDMGHFMIAHLQDGEYDGKRILTAATAQQMHNSPATFLPPLNRMELGFFETNINGHEVIGHLGDTEDFHTSLHLFLKDNVGFYVSFNSLGKDGAAEGLRSAIFQDFADRYFPAIPPKPRVDAKTAAEHAALLTGSWVNSRGSRSNFLSVLDLVGQTQVGLDAKGGLVVPFVGLNGQPRHWVEVAPFVWDDLDSHERLAAQVVDGKPVRFSIDLLSPFMVFERPAWYRNSTWLKPVFFASAAALLLTALLWPVAALTRRQFGARLALDAASLQAYRFSKIAATAIVVAIALWGTLLTLMLKDNTMLSASSDVLLHLVQLVGIVAFLGGFILILINLRAVWTGQRRWPAKVWSVVLSLSSLTVLWTACVFKLMSFGANY
jgi:CubicO group peptidase (beta-lactamase class C family)